MKERLRPLISTIKQNSAINWVVIHDGGEGITIESLQFFKDHARQIGRVFEINLNHNALFHMEIIGTEGIILLSGCNCGYRGEGPHGSAAILKRLGILDKAICNKVFSKKNLTIDLRDFNSKLKC